MTVITHTTRPIGSLILTSFRIGRCKWALAEQRDFLTLLQMGLKTGIPLDTLLSAIATHYPKLAPVIGLLNAELQSGKTLGSLLQSWALFPPHIQLLIRLGQQYDRLTETIEDALTSLTASYQLRSRLVAKLTYPLLVLISTLGFAIVAINYFIPTIVTNYQTYHLAPPMLLVLLTRIQGWHYILAIIFCCGASSILAYQSRHSLAVQQALLKWVPIYRNLVSAVFLDEFLLLLTVSNLHKVPLHEVLQDSALHCAMPLFAFYQSRMSFRLSSGESLPSILRDIAVMPPVYAQLLSFAWEHHSIEAMIPILKKQNHADVDKWLDWIAAIAEPLTILFVGVLVAGMAYLLLIPMTQFPTQMME